MIDLTTCVKGQKLLLRDGTVIMYDKRIASGNNYSHEAIDRYSTLQTYTDRGSYYADCGLSHLDVIEILPQETTEPASHPSVAWWDSCPWITDRKPTEKDGNYISQVMMQAPGQEGTKTTCFMDWKYVKPGQTWIHCMNWNPPKQTPKEKAMELINNHSPEGNGIVEDDWKPTTEQWLIIRKGLEAS